MRKMCSDERKCAAMKDDDAVMMIFVVMNHEE